MQGAGVHNAHFDINDFYQELEREADNSVDKLIDHVKKRHTQFADNHEYIKNIKKTIADYLFHYLNLRQDKNGNYLNKYNVKYNWHRITNATGYYLPMMKFWSDDKPRRDIPELSYQLFEQLLQQAKSNFMNDQQEQQQWQLYYNLITQADDIASFNGASQLYQKWFTKQEPHSTLERIMQDMLSDVKGYLDQWEQDIKERVKQNVSDQLQKRKTNIQQNIENKFNEILGKNFRSDDNIINYLKLIENWENYEYVMPQDLNGDKDQSQWHYRLFQDKQDEKQRYEQIINESYQVQIQQLLSDLCLRYQQIWSPAEIKSEEYVEVSLRGQIQLINQVDKDAYSQLVNQVYQHKTRSYNLPAEMESYEYEPLKPLQ